VIGYESWNEARDFRLQVTLSSINASWLGSYPGGDEVLRVLLEKWPLFLDRTAPQQVTRLAIRTVNRLVKPWNTIESVCGDFRTWNALPEMGTPRLPLLHFHRMGAPGSVPVQIQLGQILEEPRGTSPLAVILDVDAWTDGNWTAAEFPLSSLFQQVRDGKNQAFFASFTEGADAWLR
jgi:uncharacterized protein (TIGR04255 family)